MDSVIQFRGTIYENGYGLIAQSVIRDNTLSKWAKLIYSYMCSFASVGKDGERSAFPSVSLQCSELGMSEDTYYKWRQELIDRGLITVEKRKNEKGRFERNLYFIEAVPKRTEEKEPKKAPSNQDQNPYPNKSGTDDPYPNTPSTDIPCTDKSGTNSTRTNSTSINNDDENKETRVSMREELSQLTDTNPHLKSLFDYLKREMLDPYIVQDIMTEMLDQHVVDYRLIDARNQLDYMKDQISKGESYTYFGRFFVNGLKKRSQTALDVEHEKEITQQKQAQRDTSMYYDWLHDGLHPDV